MIKPLDCHAMNQYEQRFAAYISLLCQAREQQSVKACAKAVLTLIASLLPLILLKYTDFLAMVCS